MHIMRTLLILVAGSCLAACADPVGTPVAGTLERDRIALNAEASEPLTAIHVREGDAIEAGQVLVQLDTQRAQARVARARAELSRAQRQLDELIRGPRQERILEVRAQLAGAESRLETARQEYARIARLVEQDILSQAGLDRARSERDSAAANYEATRAQLAALLHGATIEELDQARAVAAAATAALQETQLALDRLTIRAPVAARVEALPFELGEYPPPGSAVAIVLATEPVYVRVYLPQPLRLRLAAGASAAVSVAGIENPLPARIRYIAADAAFTPYYSLTEHDRSRLAYLAEIDITDPGDHELPSGIPVQVTFPDLRSGD